jgi:protein tyrosine phosphatase
VVVRRAHKSVDGTIAEASRPIIAGNCSAGVGRTGTFCAVHSALQSFQEQLNRGVTAPAVNILRCVMAMRERRPGMVQTKEQYIFAYLAVLERTEQLLFASGLLGADDGAAGAAAGAEEGEVDGGGADEQFDAAEILEE